MADRDTGRIHQLLDGFHAAAAAADEDLYLGYLAPEVVFLGTDPDERWQGDAFRGFVHSFFSRDKGWTYAPSSRSVELGEDGATAWFDERLENDFYGACRGTGVLQLRDGEWKIEQYSLSIPIPNEIASEIVERIRTERD